MSHLERVKTPLGWAFRGLGVDNRGQSGSSVRAHSGYINIHRFLQLTKHKSSAFGGPPVPTPTSMHPLHLKREDDAQPSGCWAVPSLPVAAAPSTACGEETQAQALGLHDLFSPSRQQETCMHLSALQSPKRGLRGVHCHVGGATGWCDQVRSPHEWFWPPRLC